jgi:hypothetical protein
MDDEIKKLLEKNLEMTEEILVMTKKIKSHVTFQKVMSAIYFLIIVVPIVLSFIYLPPLLKDAFNEYQGLLGGSDGSILNNIMKGATGGTTNGINLSNTDLKKLSPEAQNELQKLLKK